MALVLADRVRETTTVVGTGTATLLGAVVGYQSFTAIGNANTTYYVIASQTANEWEVGIGTYTASGTTLSRDTVLSSSNAGALVNFSAGTKDIWVDYNAVKAVYEDAAGNVSGYPIVGGTINNTPIGNTTPNAATFTTLTATGVSVQSSSANNGLTMVRNTDSATNSTRLFLDSSGGVAAVYNSGGSILFNTAAVVGTTSGVNQLRVAHTASAVNYVQVTGAATGGAPVTSVQGSDTNIAYNFTSKGNGAFNFFTNNSAQRQFRIQHTTSAVNFGYATGSAAGGAVTFGVDALSSDTNIDLALIPKGTGLVRFGTRTASADAPITGYIEIKDSGGTVRRLAVIG